jgi:hypothetical protein
MSTRRTDLESGMERKIVEDKARPISSLHKNRQLLEFLEMSVKWSHWLTVSAPYNRSRCLGDFGDEYHVIAPYVCKEDRTTLWR